MEKARPRPDTAIRTLDSIVFEVASAYELFNYMWHMFPFLWLIASLIRVSVTFIQKIPDGNRWEKEDIQVEVTEKAKV